MDLVITSIFLLDIIIQFRSAFMDRRVHPPDLVEGRWRIAARYLRSWFIIDFVGECGKDEGRICTWQMPFVRSIGHTLPIIKNLSVVRCLHATTNNRIMQLQTSNL